MILSPHEVAWVVAQTWPGTTPDEQVHAVAVELAEANGDTDVIARSPDTIPAPTGPGLVPNPNAGNRDHGLFQLSGKWQWDKIIAAGGDWRDPLVNSAIAYQIFLAAGRKFTPWHVYQSETVGSWLGRLPDARLAVPHPFPLAPAWYNRGPVELTRIQNALDRLQAEYVEIKAGQDVIASTGARILGHFA